MFSLPILARVLSSYHRYKSPVHFKSKLFTALYRFLAYNILTLTGDLRYSFK